MPSHNHPGMGINGGWNRGENQWDGPVNENWRKISVFLQLAVAAFKEPLPASPADGFIAIAPDGRVAVRDTGAWFYFVPQAGISAWITPQKKRVEYDGTDWVDTPWPTMATKEQAEEGSSNTVFMSPVRGADQIKAMRPYSTQAQAEAGTNDASSMTPLSTKQAIAKFAPTVPGFASQAQAEAGTADNLIMSPLRGSQQIEKMRPKASTAEAVAGDDDAKFVTAAGVKAAVAAQVTIPTPTANNLAAQGLHGTKMEDVILTEDIVIDALNSNQTAFIVATPFFNAGAAVFLGAHIRILDGVTGTASINVGIGDGSGPGGSSLAAALPVAAGTERYVGLSSQTIQLDNEQAIIFTVQNPATELFGKGIIRLTVFTRHLIGADDTGIPPYPTP